MKEKLKVGDVIRRFEITKEVDYDYVIHRVTKTQAITKNKKRFKIDYQIGSRITKLAHHIAMVDPIGDTKYCNYPYYLIDKTKL